MTEPIIASLAILGSFYGGVLMARQLRSALDEKKQKAKVEQLASALAGLSMGRERNATDVVAGRNVLVVGDRVVGDLVGGEIVQRKPVDERKPTDEVRTLIEGLVNGYHQQALEQAKQQFRFSVAAASVGFVWILIAGWNAVGAVPEQYMQLLPGTVINAIAFLFFRQSEQTRERATALYDRLRVDNQTVTAVSLVERIDDLQIRSVVKAQLALHLAGLSPAAIELSHFLTKPPPDGAQ